MNHAPTMKIYILPFPFPSSHPYLTSLYDNLDTHIYHVYNTPNPDTTQSKNTSYTTRLKIRAIRSYRIYSSLLLPWNRHPIDIIHLHWIEYLLLFSRSRAKRIILFLAYVIWLCFIRYILQKRIVTTIHNVEPHRTISPLLERYVFQFSIVLSHALIVHNNHSKEKLIQTYNMRHHDISKVAIVPHGNYTGVYPDTISPTQARQELHIPHDAFVLLFLGQLRPHTKGIETTIASLRTLIPTHPEIHCIFAGECLDQTLRKDIHTLHEQFPTHITAHTQYIPNLHVQRYLNASDIGLIPYAQISTSGIMLLYMTWNKPVIASKIPPFEELLGTYELYCTPDDVASLTQTIIGAQHQNLDAIGQRLGNLASRQDWAQSATHTSALYQSLLNHS